MAQLQHKNYEEDNEYINQVIHDRNGENVIELLDKLKQLTQAQAEVTLIKAAKLTKDAKDGLQNKVEGVKNWITSGERRYGAKNQEAKQIVKQCQDTCIEIYQTFEQARNEIVERKGTYQNQEYYEMTSIVREKESLQNSKRNLKVFKHEIERIESTPEYKSYTAYIEDAKEKLYKAVEIGDIAGIDVQNDALEEYQNKRNELYGNYKEKYKYETEKITNIKSNIKMNKQNIKELRSNIKEEDQNLKETSKTSLHAIDVSASEKNKQLMKIEKQNAIAKFISSVRDKIGGAKKLANNIIEPVKEEISTIKEENLPAFKKAISDKMEQGKEKVEKTVEKSKQSAKEIVQKGKLGVKETGKVTLAVAYLTGVSTKYVATGVKIGLGQAAGKVVEGTANGVKTLRGVINSTVDKKNDFIALVKNGIEQKPDQNLKEKSKDTELEK